MFTVKIVKEDGSSTLRSWSSVDIHKKGTTTFDDFMDMEEKRLVPEYYEFHNSDSNRGRTPYPEEQQFLDAIKSYKAVLIELGTDNDYYMAGDEVAYVMDSHGNTVEVIK